jgi:hypothetical protein
MSPHHHRTHIDTILPHNSLLFQQDEVLLLTPLISTSYYVFLVWGICPSDSCDPKPASFPLPRDLAKSPSALPSPHNIDPLFNPKKEQHSSLWNLYHVLHQIWTSLDSNENDFDQGWRVVWRGLGVLGFLRVVHFWVPVSPIVPGGRAGGVRFVAGQEKQWPTPCYDWC